MKYTPYVRDPIIDLLSLDLGDALLYKGIIDCSTNPNYPAADRGHVYIVSVAGKIGGASGEYVFVGDTLVCKTDSTPSGNQATVGNEWNIIEKEIKYENIVEIKVFDYTTNVATGDGKAYFVVPDELNGMNLVRTAATVITVGSTNSTTMQIRNVTASVDILSTLMKIESGEFSTRTSASPCVIDTTKNDVDTGDVLRLDVDTVASIAPQGLIWEMSFQLP